MKKYTIIAVILSCMTAFSGCSALSTSSKIQTDTATLVEKNENSEAEAKETESGKINENSENNDEKASEENVDNNSEINAEKNSEETTEAQLNKDNETENSEAEENQPETEVPEQQERTEEEIYEDSESAEDIESIAAEQFEKSCEMQWSYLIGCPYELDYTDTYEYAVRVVGLNSISDVLADYNEVFDGNCPELAEKYIETQYGLYCYDGGRGSNIYYQDTDLELISYEGNTAVFNAISHYTDPETGEPQEDKINTFTIINCDGVWKTSEFTLPY